MHLRLLNATFLGAGREAQFSLPYPALPRLPDVAARDRIQGPRQRHVRMDATSCPSLEHEELCSVSTDERRSEPTVTKSSRREKFMAVAPELLHLLEVGLAACAVAIVVVGVVYLFRMFVGYDSPQEPAAFLRMFEDTLSALLLLVVGVELAIMLCLRRPESLIEIMFFVIARKVLIKTEHVYELIVAVAAMAALFAIEKYLMVGERKLFGTERKGE